MCGIFCRVGLSGSFTPSDVLKGLRRIDYRGYDSFGVGIGGSFIKAVGIPIGSSHLRDSLTLFPLVTSENLVVMGHTRWATHGGNSVENCQPLQIDGKLCTSLCHNGIIPGMDCPPGVSDSRQLAGMLAGCNTWECLESTLSTLEGKNAFAISTAKGVYCYTRGMPLFIGHDSISYFVTSNIKSVEGKFTYVAVPEKTLVYLTPETIFGLPLNTKRFSQTNPIHKDDPSTTFMLEEIRQQESLLNSKVSKINLKKYRYVVACGSSYNAAIYGSFVGKYKLYYPDEIMYLKQHMKSFKINDGELLVISQSGETMDIIRAVEMLGVKFDCLVNNEGLISLHHNCREVFKMRCGEERAVAATKSFLATVLKLYGREITGLGSDTANRFGVESVHEDVKEFIRETNIHLNENIFLLYDTNNSFLAHEAALKLKEVAGVHAEPIHVKEVRHGTLSLLTRKTDPCIALSPISEDVEKQLESRKIPCYTLNKYFSICDKLFFLQLLSHEIGLLRGYDVDRPVGIAKCITV